MSRTITVHLKGTVVLFSRRYLLFISIIIFLFWRNDSIQTSLSSLSKKQDLKKITIIKKIDISNQLICDYYISHTRSADYFMRLIVSVSLGGCLRFRLCKNKRALFVWECDSINWMLLIAGVIVQESKNRRKTILTFPGSFVKLTAEI